MIALGVFAQIHVADSLRETSLIAGAHGPLDLEILWAPPPTGKLGRQSQYRDAAN